MFRTPIGFHDAYVAAPSQKAALEAWGSGSNLFAAGAAELVTDPKLTREPLARPGEVVRVLRGSAEEQVRALGATKAKGRPSPQPSPARGRGRKGGPTPGPSRSRKRGARPSSAAVEKAQAALERAEARHRLAIDKLKAEERKLERRRRELEAKQSGEHDRLARAVDKARERYRAAIAEWDGASG